MKRKEFVRQLIKDGCIFLRVGNSGGLFSCHCGGTASKEVLPEGLLELFLLARP
jgi:hypothetical protein